jgi:hypothetical protein
MTSFEAGFNKYAKECGLSPEKAAHILKRALEHPDTQQMFKELPDQENNQNPDELDTLANLAHQDSVDNAYSEAAKKIQLR